MHCRSCGNEVNDKAVLCVSCGIDPKYGKWFCKECGGSTSYNDKICRHCGCAISQYDFSYLSGYYQNEFTRIEESDGRYTGKFNWFAWLFTGLWALSKGLWLSAIIGIIIGTMAGITDSGLKHTINFVYSIAFGFRANYLYYINYTQDKHELY